MQMILSTSVIVIVESVSNQTVYIQPMHVHVHDAMP